MKIESFIAQGILHQNTGPRENVGDKEQLRTQKLIFKILMNHIINCKLQ